MPRICVVAKKSETFNILVIFYCYHDKDTLITPNTDYTGRVLHNNDTAKQQDVKLTRLLLSPDNRLYGALKVSRVLKYIHYSKSMFA